MNTALIKNIKIDSCGMSLDWSRQRIADHDLKEIIDYSNEINLLHFLREMAEGVAVNPSESRPALHTALRSFNPLSPHYEEILFERNRMLDFAERIRSSGVIRDVINVGIGGSEMGPHAVWHALRPLNPSIRLHFLSSVDGILLDRILAQCIPMHTLVVISSKSFHTRETIVNAKYIDEWLNHNGITGDSRNHHVVTVSSYENAAESIGLRKENGFRIWPWVGGRFSVWSSIGLPLALGLGRENFLKFLYGAYEMDKHALNALPYENLPLLMALFSYWDSKKLEIPSMCLLPYDSRLDLMPAWLQQLEMESLGKHSSSSGEKKILGRTGQGVWGNNGNNGQHSFYQWLREGTWCTSVDLIKVLDPGHRHKLMSKVLNANADAQMNALVTRDNNFPEYFNTLRVITLDNISPQTIGSLMAMYEHKTVLLGKLFGINPFDQPGVEFAKKIANKLENNKDDK